MSEHLYIAAADPLRAPLWRKLLAARAFLLCLVGISLSCFLVNWIEAAKLDIPKGFEDSFFGVIVLPLYTIFYTLPACITDLVVHFVPEGRFRRLYIGSGRTPEAMATKFEKRGYAIALLPLVIPLVLGALALIALLLFGGVALVSGVFSSMFSGWPAWAVVVTLLLVAILLKK
jgi:hypothetical protein